DLRDVDALAHKLFARGIRRVTGRVLGDEHRFDGERGGPGWKPSFLGIESAPLSALSVRGVELRTSNSSAFAAAQAFREALIRTGVRVAGVAGRGRAPLDALPLAYHRSAPLSAVVREMNHESDNFVAEMLLKELGATVAGRGSTAAGRHVVRDALAEAGVPLDGVRLADGSGLSLRDRLTVGALAAESYARSARRSSSERTGTPSFSAFCSFEPGLSPAITPAVFPETESETFAPSASSAALACSRDHPSSVPVMTYWRPVSGP